MGDGKMIYVNLRGNCGNQMFQYALARQIQKETNQDIVLSTYALDYDNIGSVYILKEFKADDNVTVTNKNILPKCMKYNSKIVKGIRKLFPNLYRDFISRKGYITDLCASHFYHKPYLDKKFKNYYIDGWFQSENYFHDISPMIKQDFKLKNTDNNENYLNLLKQINDSNSVCVTIRRGDYISNLKYKKIFYVCDLNYFNNAISEMTKKITNPTFFIFSDDIDWIKENVKCDYPMIFENSKFTIGEKISLMSSCKHFIISNSSFSWWCQYLSGNNDKTVIAPSYWYNTDKRKIGIYDNQNWFLMEVEHE